jgi:transposase-like protein
MTEQEIAGLGPTFATYLGRGSGPSRGIADADEMNTTTLESTVIPPCPRCAATHVVRNGPNTAGTPTFRCRACGRRFVSDPQKGPVSDDKRSHIRRLLGERLSLRAIARVVGVSRSWLQEFVNDLYERTPWEPGPLKKSPVR